MKILLVVPRSLAGYMEVGIRAEGYEVDWTEDVVAADGLVGPHRPALVILDLDSSAGNQIPAVRTLAGGPPVLALTANRDVAEDHLAPVADAYLTKPFRLDALLDQVQTLTNYAV